MEKVQKENDGGLTKEAEKVFGADITTASQSLSPNDIRKASGIADVAYAKDYIPTYCRFNQKAKADAGKLPMNLVPTQISRDIAQVRQYGNEKYGDPDNWRKVEKLRYVAALERHLLAYKDYLNGDDDGVDKESGIDHYKHMACNMAFICEMERWEKAHE